MGKLGSLKEFMQADLMKSILEVKNIHDAPAAIKSKLLEAAEETKNSRWIVTEALVDRVYSSLKW